MCASLVFYFIFLYVEHRPGCGYGLYTQTGAASSVSLRAFADSIKLMALWSSQTHHVFLFFYVLIFIAAEASGESGGGTGEGVRGWS